MQNCKRGISQGSRVQIAKVQSANCKSAKVQKSKVQILKVQHAKAQKCKVQIAIVQRAEAQKRDKSGQQSPPRPVLPKHHSLVLTPPFHHPRWEGVSVHVIIFAWIWDWGIRGVWKFHASWKYFDHCWIRTGINPIGRQQEGTGQRFFWQIMRS